MLRHVFDVARRVLLANPSLSRTPRWEVTW